MAQLPLTFDTHGLVPVIVQDHLTGEVRMLAFATPAAIQSTRETGRATFWSRSRNELWEKGRTSGNEIRVLRVLVDCDADCVIYSSEPHGNSCHTGAPSCFFQTLEGEAGAEKLEDHAAAKRENGGGASGEKADKTEPPTPPQTLLATLESMLEARKRSTGKASYTKSLYDAGAPKIAAKLREEAGEAAQAIESESDERVVSEAADVLYHLIVGLRWRSIPLRRVFAELARRVGTSGHEEKASRRPDPVRIAFFGLPLAAVLLAGDGHDIVYAAASRRAPGLRRLMTRIAPRRTELRPRAVASDTLERVRAARPDLIVSWFWTTRLPESILRLAPSVGVHPSLLPRHRGPDPCFWAIDAGDEITGVTAHRLGVEYDTGDVLARRELRVDPAWNGWLLARALDRPSLALLREVVRAHAEGPALAAIPQDELAATAAPSLTDEELAIVWSWPAARIERRVRAAAPWPGAWTEIGDRIVTLVRVRPTRDFPRALEPGEAGLRADGVAVVRTGDGAVELVEGRTEDERPLADRDLADLVRAAQREGQ